MRPNMTHLGTFLCSRKFIINKTRSSLLTPFVTSHLMFDSYSHLDSFKAGMTFKQCSNYIPYLCIRLDESIADHRLRLIVAFDVLQMFGLISLSVILCTVWFSSRVRRSTAWFSFNFAWAFSCVGYLLILGYQTGPSPGHVLCLCQTMLIYACPALLV